MSLTNGLNYFEYLLLNSLRVKNYELVGRDFLKQLILELKEWCDCKYCSKIRLIKWQFKKRDFNTTNKDCEWWKIVEKWGEITVIPERESES